MKTRKETFDIVYSAILTQGSLSKKAITGECYYRSPDGKKCAAGHLIPDSEYFPEMESRLCFSQDEEERKSSLSDDLLIVDKISEILKNQGHDPEFVKELQKIHDDSNSIEEWKEKMFTLVI